MKSCHHRRLGILRLRKQSRSQKNRLVRRCSEGNWDKNEYSTSSGTTAQGNHASNRKSSFGIGPNYAVLERGGATVLCYAWELKMTVVLRSRTTRSDQRICDSEPVIKSPRSKKANYVSADLSTDSILSTRRSEVISQVRKFSDCGDDQGEFLRRIRDDSLQATYSHILQIMKWSLSKPHDKLPWPPLSKPTTRSRLKIAQWKRSRAHSAIEVGVIWRSSVIEK